MIPLVRQGNLKRTHTHRLWTWWIACFLCLPITSGCIVITPQTTTFSEIHRARGTGRKRNYRVPFDRVWEAIPLVVTELGLEVAGKNKKEGYLLAERGTAEEKIVIFVERRGDGTHTHVEVISKKVLGLAGVRMPNYPNWEPQILKNLSKKLSVPTWKSTWLQGKSYFKFGLGIIAGGKKIPMRMMTSETPEQFLKSWWGIHPDLVYGYDINERIGVELGIGAYVTSGDNCFLCSDDVPGLKRANFERFPLTATILYHFYKQDAFPAMRSYLSGGIGYYFSPELEKVDLGVKTTVNYDDALGYHVGGGLSWGTRFFSFLDVKYIFGLKYRFQDMDVDGVKQDTTFPEWRTLDGDGVLFSFGIGYHFQ